MGKIQKSQSNKRCRNGIKWLFIPLILFLILVIGVLIFNHFFILNVSSSIPLGIYYKYPPKKNYRLGEIVIFKPWKNYEMFLYRQNYLEPGDLLMKYVQGLPGDSFSSFPEEENIWVLFKNGKTFFPYSRIFEKDSSGRFLPRFQEITIAEGEIFVMGLHPKSLDSRYFGSISEENIVGIAKPFFTIGGL
ncbi:S26 family signal peptidase [Fusobacterium necrophorum]|uniref:Peptidase S26 domain-containing protein n=1 Tax=Fusobacterium necrophorum TaxID=859 RepID=A0A4Q2L022_9FUSO|nr:S26 family signal peptidase [Fusobacterium necrophorum]RXZ70699.1 hypothetical protein EPT53_03180 [Fusobacterium necrophorum]